MKHRSAKPCGYTGCTGFVWSRGYCAAHYTKLKKSGKLATVKHQGTMRERFEKLHVVNPDTECWEWVGPLQRDGYGLLSTTGRGGAVLRAHRWAYTEFVEPLPPEVKVLHSCDNRKCVNWTKHLFAGTQKDNMQDCSAKGRTGSRQRRLTAKMAQNIRIMYAREYSLETLAKIYPVCLTTVNAVVKGKLHLKATLPGKISRQKNLRQM